MSLENLAAGSSGCEREIALDRRVSAASFSCDDAACLGPHSAARAVNT
jgi:hypothetical protein